jgi:hypothetical protein
LELPIERLVAKLYERESGCGEVIIEEEEYGFMVTNFGVNGRLWRGDLRDQEFKPLMSVLFPAPHPFSYGCNPSITDVDDDTEEPESYEKELQVRKEESDHEIKLWVIIK